MREDVWRWTATATTVIGAVSEQRNRVPENMNVNNSRNRSSIHDGRIVTVVVGTVGIKGRRGRKKLGVATDSTNNTDYHQHCSTYFFS